MNKQFVVTGASRGIGYEITRKLLSQGHCVLALSRNIKPLKSIACDRLEYVCIDLSKKKSFDILSEKLSQSNMTVDVLIHNAGSLVKKPFEDLTLDDFMGVYHVNVFGVAMLTQKLIPVMTKNAHVVAISSMGGVQGSAKFPELAAYSSSKGAVITLMEVLAETYKSKNISFNTLALGAVDTEMLKEAFPDYKAPITAAEMADFICDFSQTGHRYFNGKTIPVARSTP